METFSTESSEDFLKRVTHEVDVLREKGAAIDLIVEKFIELCDYVDIGYIITVEEKISEWDGKVPNRHIQLKANASEAAFKRTVMLILDEMDNKQLLLEIREAIESKLNE
jgi:hypothetical protein